VYGTTYNVSTASPAPMIFFPMCPRLVMWFDLPGFFRLG
jgi:hypothetical protein